LYTNFNRKQAELSDESFAQQYSSNVLNSLGGDSDENIAKLTV
jgi:hypothetical protein